MKGRRERRDNRRSFYRNKLIATMIIVMGVVISINSADNKTEFGVMDDFTVWGVEGTLDDPDLEIKGFSVFGATQPAYTANIDNGPGNVMINGVLGVSSGAYIAGISTISYITNINTTSMTITGNGITGSSPIFKVAGSTMVILNDGRVGIGTTNPGAKLDVNGNAKIGGGSIIEKILHGRITGTHNIANGWQEFSTFVGTDWATTNTKAFVSAAERPHGHNGDFGGLRYIVGDSFVDSSGYLRVLVKLEYSSPGYGIEIDYMLIR